MDTKKQQQKNPSNPSQKPAGNPKQERQEHNPSTNKNNPQKKPGSNW